MEAKQILKSNILDILFENRNKAYGAYDIRMKYRARVNKSLIFAISGLVLILLLPTIISWLTKTTAPVQKVEKVVNVTVLAPPPPLEKPPPPPEIPKPPPPKLLTFKPPRIVKTQVLDTMPTVTELKKQPVVSAPSTTGTSMNFTPPPAEQKVVEQPKPETIYTTYDEPPVPPGGADGYKKFLEEHIHFPQQAVDAGASGTVYVSIVVSKDGTLSDVHVEKDNVHYGCGDEAVRVIKTMPPWKPGKMNGVAVKVRYVIPVKFTLH